MRVRITLSEKEVKETILESLRDKNLIPLGTHFEFKTRKTWNNSHSQYDLVFNGIECDVNPKSLEDDF